MPPSTAKPIFPIPFKGFSDSQGIQFTTAAKEGGFKFFCAAPAEVIKSKYGDVAKVPKIKTTADEKAVAEAANRRYGAGAGVILQLGSSAGSFLLGMGKCEDDKPTSRVVANKMALGLATFIREQRPEALSFDLSYMSEETFPFFMACLKFALYVEDRFRRVNAKNIPMEASFAITSLEGKPLSEDKLASLMAEADKIAEGLLFKREIADAPPNYCHPESFMEAAKKVCEENDNLSFKAFNFQECFDMGMGGFCAVSQGMTNEAYFLHIQYKSGNPTKRFSLVGKGVCMDTGGYAIKPAQGMLNMHHDMGGAAVTMGAAIMIAKQQPEDLHVDFFIPLVENLIDAQAYLNGDVITTMSGLKVMVNNTDAEGRMILCDGIAYAQKVYADEKETKPCTIATIATLTGAAIVALGDKMAPFYCNDDEIASKVKEASDFNVDKVWRMPLTSEYNFMDSDDRGDLVNVIYGGKNGSVNAAKFLEAFVMDEDVKFMHFDIAGCMTNAKSQSDIYGPQLMTDVITSCSKN